MVLLVSLRHQITRRVKTALVIDDDSIVLTVLARTLEDAGWRVPFDANRFRGYKAINDLVDADSGKVVVEAGKKITVPMLALWGAAGVAGQGRDPLDIWRDWATDVRGAPIDSGHYLPEEAPEATSAALLDFFA